MLIYTSGTSGDPKAVICSQGKVAIAGVMMTERFGLGSDDICYVSMPLFHSNAVLGGLGGGVGCRELNCVAAQVLRISVPSRHSPLRRDLRELRRQAVVVRARHTRSGPTTPTTRCGRFTATRAHPPTSRGSQRRFNTLVMDGFGSTEGGIAIGRTPDTPPGALGPLPDGTEIVDVETGEPCPPGVTGELVNVAGAGRFEGYYNDPEADAERMRGGVYHSGDLAYRDENNFAYFAGRLGDWMRVDGENLGSAPIERVLLRHPDVVEVAVYGIPAPDVGDQVMAALVLTDGAASIPRVPRVPRRAARPRPQTVAVVRAGRLQAAAHRDIQDHQAPTAGRGRRLPRRVYSIQR